MTFSKRKRIVDDFNEWIKDQNNKLLKEGKTYVCMNDNLTFMTYLELCGYLSEEGGQK